ncbi:MAG: undecaprenyldiphospho-muramoylpentapeptide beta-N-acetylglucosaminyltransferase [Bacteroidetes bacterium]|nr:undecaprenyldiphospho-muramoylpentapeptide beta-N-acetylglucosaminyltransferase [Bacteroidota bacterium]MBM3424071.1 undecaprenyldiphospho-muramoylpentapeptide beta-N-acetylglucosaminyltransferase [Bacteroidota bacterium]
MNLQRVIISGGGTGGHIYPAIAIAKAIRNRFPACLILFIGADGKMEMEKVPQAGFDIKGLKIAGFNRKSWFKNLSLPAKVFKSLVSVRSILKEYKPQVVIGVGGYASGPTLQMAQWMKIPTVIQEQNSYPGKTNLLLAKKAKAICVAYDSMNRFFPEANIVKTGNPVRTDIMDWNKKQEEGYAFYQLNKTKKTVLVIGGSLGAKTLNQAVLNHFGDIEKRSDLQVLWQCGATHYAEMNVVERPPNLHLLAFVERMDLAYAVADLIVSRAGATSISELSLVAKPIVLVPSPNVSEDHQTKNAQALSQQGAAILCPDADAPKRLWQEIYTLLDDVVLANNMSEALRTFALPNATEEIVDICHKIVSDE